ncbi:MAG: redoxin domain-containing protein [bacterium JZ-2024 1]
MRGGPQNFPIIVTAVVFLVAFSVLYQNQRKFLMPAGNFDGGRAGIALPDESARPMNRTRVGSTSFTGMTTNIPEETFILVTRDVLLGMRALELEPEPQKRVAPVLTVTDARGNRVTFPRPGKRFLFVNFWATWCTECRKEMPSMQKLWEKAQQDGDWDVVYVNWGENPDTAEKFLLRENLTLKTYYDRKKEVGKLFGVTGVPETFFINAQGLIITHVIGPRLNWASPESFAMIDSFRTGMGAGVFPPSPAKPMDPADLKKRIDSGSRDYVLIDLRPEEEYTKGFIPTSFNFPPSLLMEHLGLLPVDMMVIFVSSDGEQARRMAEAFGKMGYPEIRYLIGGVAGWRYGLTTANHPSVS